MPLKQSTMFDFVAEPEQSLAAEQNIIVEEMPREIEVSLEKNSVSHSSAKPLEKRRGRMKLSEAALTAGLVDVPDDEELFKKQYYSISAVAKMFSVNISLLRFWENEFDALKPKKNGKGDRLFRPEDIKTLKLIHHLLREKKYTIEGAKDFLKQNKKAEQNFALIDELKKLKLFLNELKLSLQ